MEKLSNMPFFKKITEKGKWNVFVILGLVGVILIAASEFIPQKGDKTSTSETATTLEGYRVGLESDSTSILSCVNGVGNVKVMVTLESSEEYVYAQQEKSTGDSQTVFNNTTNQETVKNTYENQFVMVEGSGAKNALVEKTLQPSIQGVVVVCEGAGDIRVISDVTNAAAVALNVSTNRICVIQMQ